MLTGLISAALRWGLVEGTDGTQLLSLERRRLVVALVECNANIGGTWMSGVGGCWRLLTERLE